MKSGLAIALLAGAAAAEQELQVAKNLDYAMAPERAYYETHYGTPVHEATPAYRTPVHRERRDDHHSRLTRYELPAGYAMPRDVHSYEPRHERYYQDEYRYHPQFANETIEEENKAGSPGKGGSPKRGSPGPKGKPQSPGKQGQGKPKSPQRQPQHAHVQGHKHVQGDKSPQRQPKPQPKPAPQQPKKRDPYPWELTDDYCKGREAECTTQRQKWEEAEKKRDAELKAKWKAEEDKRDAEKRAKWEKEREAKHVAKTTEEHTIQDTKTQQQWTTKESQKDTQRRQDWQQQETSQHTQMKQTWQTEEDKSHAQQQSKAPSKVQYQDDRQQQPAPQKKPPQGKEVGRQREPHPSRPAQQQPSRPQEQRTAASETTSVPKSLQPLLAPIFQDHYGENPYSQSQPFYQQGPPLNPTLRQPGQTSPYSAVAQPFGTSYPSPMMQQPLMSSMPSQAMMMPGQPMMQSGYAVPSARGTPLAPATAQPPTQIVKPYGYTAYGYPAAQSPLQADPFSEIGFGGMDPFSEFASPYDAKQWQRAMVDPEADPRFGVVGKRGFQIDQAPFKAKAKEEKRRQKQERKQEKLKTKQMQFKNDVENGIPVANSEEAENKFFDTAFMHDRPMHSTDEFRHHLSRHEDEYVGKPFGFEIEEDDNLLDLVHPASEGKDTSHKKKKSAAPQAGDDQLFSDQGRQFAMLDWDMSQPRGRGDPALPPQPITGFDDIMEGEHDFDFGEPMVEEPQLDSDEELLEPDEKGFVERSKAMKWDGKEDYHDWRQRKEDQEQRDREEKARIERDLKQKEREERERRDEDREQNARDKKAKKPKKDKKKGKKGKNEKPIKHEALDEDDESEEEGDTKPAYSYHSHRRHGYDGDESKRHHGYNNAMHHGKRRYEREEHYETPASLRPLLEFDDHRGDDDYYPYMDAKHHEYRREREREYERDLKARREFHERPIYAEDHHFDHSYDREELEWPERREHRRERAYELEWPETTKYYHDGKDKVMGVHEDHQREHYKFDQDREERDWYDKMERRPDHQDYESLDWVSLPERHEPVRRETEQKTKSKKSSKKASKSEKNDEESVDFYRDYDDQGHYDSYTRTSYKVADTDSEDYPVYPYEGEIHYDSAKGYSTYYDPYYDELSHYESHYDHEDYTNAPVTTDKKSSKPKKQHRGVPLRRKYDRSPYEPRSRRHNGLTDNETPMYVRPYLEDPIFLQPDDEESELLHPHYDEEHHADKDAKKHHDLPGDPDLEAAFSGDEHETEQEPQWIAEHRNTLARTAALTSNEGANPNGFRKQGELCNHNFECISGKCLSFMNKAPACMPF